MFRRSPIGFASHTSTSVEADLDTGSCVSTIALDALYASYVGAVSKIYIEDLGERIKRIFGCMKVAQ
jgi:hypothetical protein